jgi:hypothetical protein
MKEKYLYKKCALCEVIKEPNRSPYCKSCASDYGRKWRILRKLKPNVNIEGLGNFIEKIKRQNHNIGFDDILVILFFYEIITDNINEYDKYKSGRQIYLMWQKINRYYNKKTK